MYLFADLFRLITGLTLQSKNKYLSIPSGTVISLKEQACAMELEFLFDRDGLFGLMDHIHVFSTRILKFFVEIGNMGWYQEIWWLQTVLTETKNISMRHVSIVYAILIL